MRYLALRCALLLLALCAAGPVRPARAVIGGQPAAPAAGPWMVALIDSRAAAPAAGFFCGGTLVAPRWVITAAHCLTGGGGNQGDAGTPRTPASLKVLIGRASLSGAGGAIMSVARLVLHPDFRIQPDGSLRNDVGLLELAQPADAPTLRLADSGDAAPGALGTLLGWGSTDPQQIVLSDALRQVDLSLVSNAVCQASHQGRYVITEQMLCAGRVEGGADQCKGDSGGPLLVTVAGQGLRQVGIVSFSAGCAQPATYGVYARVDALRAWIDAQIGAPQSPRKIYLPLVRS